MRFAVDRSGRRERDPSRAGRAHRLEHVERRDGVLLEVLPRMFDAEPDVGVGGEVEHDLGAGHGLDQSRQVERIAANQGELRM